MRIVFLIAGLIVSINLFGQVEPLPRHLKESGNPFIKNYLPVDYDAIQQNWAVLQDSSGPILNGLGNSDLLYGISFDGKPFEGFTLRLFNSETKLWRLYWGDSNTGVLDPPVVGSFKNNVGHFFVSTVIKVYPLSCCFAGILGTKNTPYGVKLFLPTRAKLGNGIG